MHITQTADFHRLIDNSCYKRESIHPFVRISTLPSFHILKLVNVRAFSWYHVLALDSTMCAHIDMWFLFLSLALSVCIYFTRFKRTQTICCVISCSWNRLYGSILGSHHHRIHWIVGIDLDGLAFLLMCKPTTKISHRIKRDDNCPCKWTMRTRKTKKVNKKKKERRRWSNRCQSWE